MRVKRRTVWQRRSKALSNSEIVKAHSELDLANGMNANGPKNVSIVEKRVGK